MGSTVALLGANGVYARHLIPRLAEPPACGASAPAHFNSYREGLAR